MATEKRLIDANDLYKEVTEKYSDITAGNYPFNIVAYDMAQLVKNAPTVDAVEVVHGRWMDNIDENGYLRNAWRKCSACGVLNFSKRPPYCPNCGAKMDGDGNA